MEKKIILAIFFLGLVVRIAALVYAQLPLNWDEVSHGYNAYSILKTGRDEWGQLLPLANFRAYGDYPLPLYMYLTIPLIALFGLTEYVIRFPALLLGSATVLVTYFLVKGISKNMHTAAIASFLLALSPWHIHQSRAVFQSTVAIFFVALGITLIVYAKRRSFFMPLGLSSLGLSLYSYHNSRIFVPLLLVVVIILYKDEIFKKRFRSYNILSVIVFFLPIIPILLSPSAQARSKWVGILNEGAIQEINTKRGNSNLSPFVSRMFYNKGTYLVQEASKNYISYFSPAFLFIRGGTQYQFSIPGRGIMYLSEIIFFYVGLIILIRKAKRKEYFLVLAWLLLAPVPASITQGSSHVIRASTMIPIPYLLVALGIVFIAELLFKKDRLKLLSYSIFGILSLLLFSSWFTEYKTTYVKDYSWAWQDGYQEIVGYLKQNYSNYQKIIITKKYGEPHEFVLFFWPWDPSKYRSDENLVRFHQSDWYWVDRFDKFYFVNDWNMIPKDGNMQFALEREGSADCEHDRCLVITSPGNIPGGWELIKTVYFQNGEKAFELYEN